MYTASDVLSLNRQDAAAVADGLREHERPPAQVRTKVEHDVPSLHKRLNEPRRAPSLIRRQLHVLAEKLAFLLFPYGVHLDLRSSFDLKRYDAEQCKRAQSFL